MIITDDQNLIIYNKIQLSFVTLLIDYAKLKINCDIYHKTIIKIAKNYNI